MEQREAGNGRNKKKRVPKQERLEETIEADAPEKRQHDEEPEPDAANRAATVDDAPLETTSAFGRDAPVCDLTEEDVQLLQQLDPWSQPASREGALSTQEAPPSSNAETLSGVEQEIAELIAPYTSHESPTGKPYLAIVEASADELAAQRELAEVALAETVQLQLRIDELQADVAEARLRAGELEATMAFERYNRESEAAEIREEALKEITALHANIAANQEHHQGEIEHLIAEHTQHIAKVMQDYEAQIEQIHKELQARSLWQVDRQGEKCLVLAVSATDAIRRAVTAKPESDSTRVLGVRSLHEKVII